MLTVLALIYLFVWLTATWTVYRTRDPFGALVVILFGINGFVVFYGLISGTK